MTKRFQLHQLDQTHSLLSILLTKLRNRDTHKDKRVFRERLELCGTLMAYELSKHLHYQSVNIQTPLALCEGKQLIENLVVCSILRAGIPLQNGVLKAFDQAEVAFISAYRKYADDGSFKIVSEYTATPPLDDKCLLICDPMLASGHSVELAWQHLSTFGKPADVHILSIVGSRQAVAYIEEKMPGCHLWIIGIDPDINDHSYIVPGLGDAGDLSFGEKLNEAP